MRSHIPQVKYRKGYLYQLAVKYEVATGIHPDNAVGNSFLHLSVRGLLTIKAGYAWDGPTGIFMFKRTIMRGSLVHDALFQLLREGHLKQHKREKVDDLLKAHCLEDGMMRARAWWVHRAVRLLAGGAADPRSKKVVWFAP